MKKLKTNFEKLLEKMDEFILAMSRYKRRKYDSAIELCDTMLHNNPQDQA